MTTLAWVGLAIAAVGNLWIIALCFQTGFFWGLGALFLPPVGLIFCVPTLRDVEASDSCRGGLCAICQQRIASGGRHVIGQPPNKRVQRTRLRSPLTRSPLDGAGS